jgi:hypothetical protein
MNKQQQKKVLDKKLSVALGRIGKSLFSAKRLLNHIFSEAIIYRQAMRQRFYFARIELIKFFYIFENCAKLTAELCDFILAQVKSAQFGNLSYLFDIYFFLTHKQALTTKKQD